LFLFTRPVCWRWKQLFCIGSPKHLLCVRVCRIKGRREESRRFCKKHRNTSFLHYTSVFASLCQIANDSVNFEFNRNSKYTISYSNSVDFFNITDTCV